MRSTGSLVALAAIANAASLQDVCTVSNVQKALPVDVITGVTIDASSVNATLVTNDSVSANDYPSAVIDYCSVTFAYSHAELDDQVLVQYWLPAPDKFQNRYLSTGGGGYAINSGSQYAPSGVIYGAVSGETDGGFGGFDINLDAVTPLANGTLNWPAIYMFGYQAHHELTVLGKAFSRLFYGLEDETKLYAYYQGCSEGGREGWSQLQRYPQEWDGAITGAPAFRFAHQQVQHFYSNVVEQTLGYYPPPCELQKIVNETITACDKLDGRKDGVVARTDLCKLHFNISSLIGTPYSCASASASVDIITKRQYGGSALPAQNGTISAEAVAVAQTILDGLKDSSGKQAYFSYQPTAAFSDAETAYNSATGEWELDVNNYGSDYVQRFINKLNTSTMYNLDNVTYDTLVDWMTQGWHEYEDSLQTTWPDLSGVRDAGVKIIHYHGESDYSIPTASSVRYHESVRSIMYPHLSYNDSQTELGEFYRLFLVPGAGHCAPNPSEPNGPWPQTNLAVMIDWVEKGVKPVTLNATVLAGTLEGENQQLCAWPLRPLWKGSKLECVYDEESLETWLYTLDAFNMPVY